MPTSRPKKFSQRSGLPLPSLAVARHRGLLTHPRDYLVDSADADWPEGSVDRDIPGWEVAMFVRRVAQRLKTYVNESGTSIRQLGKDAKVNPQTIHNILAGRTWCDLPTIWRLECELDERLWINTALPPDVERGELRRRPPI